MDFARFIISILQRFVWIYRSRRISKFNRIYLGQYSPPPPLILPNQKHRSSSCLKSKKKTNKETPDFDFESNY